MYIADARTLENFCSRLIGAKVLAIDTEFMRERTYYAKLCLMQIAAEDEVALVDPFVVDDLSPLVSLLADHRVQKVVHSGQQDLEILFQTTGAVTRPIFDTQVAATIVGFDSQMSYQSLVSQVLGVNLDKSSTYTDWARRPLSDAQIEYALNDVRYLPRLYSMLHAKLTSTGRLEWLSADFERLSDPSAFTVDPDSMWRRVKRASSLSRRALGVLQKVTAWREVEAQRRDIPRRWLLGDETLVEIARHAPQDAHALDEIRGVDSKLSNTARDALLAAVSAGLQLPDSDLPSFPKRRKTPAEADGVADLMAALIRVRAKQHGVAQPVLATREDIESLAAGGRDGSPLLEGWRRRLVGDDLLRLLEGKLSLSVVDDRLCMTRTYEDVIGDIEDGTHLA
ncbi:MAG: ribonuclease D [Actinobacteria bacterium]|nr:ribonuclease D [Actinomycetota bacterium]MCL5888240.1 ribonuclease D [Actinomycetota bacterium]